MRRVWIRGAAGLAGGMTEITDRCLFGIDGRENAEEGSVALWTLYIDDPLGDFEPGNHRFLAIEEDEAEDSEDRYFLCGYTGDAVITRGPYRTGAGRVWAVPIADVNVHLNRRVLVGGDNDRPEESDVARVQWLVDTVEASNLDGDTRYLSTDDPVDLDANDFTTQELFAVIHDASQASGKNFFVTYFGDNGPLDGYPWGYFSLFYDFAHSDAYQSSHRISNILSEVDQETTFFMGLDDDLLIDGSRIFSTVVLPYDGGVVSASRPETATETAIRDTVMPSVNVKSSTKAAARATRYVNDLATPEHRATVHVIVPRHKINAFRPGMAIEVMVSHWIEPYRSEWTWMRCLNRQVLELSEGDESTYLLTMDLSRSQPGPPAPPGTASYAILYRPDNEADSTNFHPEVLFGGTGDDPPGGYPGVPKTGLLDYVLDSPERTPDLPYLGVEATGTGTVNVDFRTSAIHVVVGPVTTTFAILLNGTPVSSVVDSRGGGGIHSESYDVIVNTDVDVVPGDIIRASVSSTASGGVLVPLGAGDTVNHLIVSGDLS